MQQPFHTFRKHPRVSSDAVNSILLYSTETEDTKNLQVSGSTNYAQQVLCSVL